MSKEPRLLVGCFLSCAVMAVAAGQDRHRYIETHKDRTAVVEYTIDYSNDAVVLTSSGGTSADTVRWVTGAGTVSWKTVDEAARTNLEAVRTGDTIHVAGILKGAAVSRDIRLDPAPWYQVFGPLMDRLLPGLTGQQEFWAVDPDNLEAHKMLVRRAGQERLAISGWDGDALKIHFSPAGALAPFWGADFWYRPADSVYLYSRLPENGGITVSAIEDPRK